jgi:hypothetical protein
MNGSNYFSYRHSPEFGPELFKLTDRELVISWRAFGVSQVKRIRMCEIRNVQVRQERLSLYIVIHGLLIVGLIWAGVHVLKQYWSSSIPIGLLLLYAATHSVVLLVRKSTKAEVAILRGRGNALLFKVHRNREEDAPLDDFVAFDRFIAAIRERTLHSQTRGRDS